ncbi:unnamed protein product, partial [Lampetra planeri]
AGEVLPLRLAAAVPTGAQPQQPPHRKRRDVLRAQPTHDLVAGGKRRREGHHTAGPGSRVSLHSSHHDLQDVQAGRHAGGALVELRPFVEAVPLLCVRLRRGVPGHRDANAAARGRRGVRVTLLRHRAVHRGR